jgi:hypothetical protein
LVSRRKGTVSTSKASAGSRTQLKIVSPKNITRVLGLGGILMTSGMWGRSDDRGSRASLGLSGSKTRTHTTTRTHTLQSSPQGLKPG